MATIRDHSATRAGAVEWESSKKYFSSATPSSSPRRRDCERLQRPGATHRPRVAVWSEAVYCVVWNGSPAANRPTPRGARGRVSSSAMGSRSYRPPRPSRSPWHEALRVSCCTVLLVALVLILGTPSGRIGALFPAAMASPAEAAMRSASSQTSMYPDLGEFKRGLKANAQRCAAAHHVQYLQVMALMEAPMRTGYDRNSKCFICCLMERYEMLTPDGEFLDGTMRRYAAELPESQLKGVVAQHLDTCLREDNEDICEKCYQFARCYYDRAKIKSEINKKQPYQRQDHNYYQGSSGRLLQTVGNWANEQWSNAANGAQSLLSKEETS